MSDDCDPIGPGSDHQVLPQPGGDLTRLLDDLVDRTEGDQVSVGDVMEAFDDRGFGALITIVGAIAAAPLVGGIPGMSIITGSLITLIAIQFVFGRCTPWVPGFLRGRSIGRETLVKGMRRARPYGAWLDSWVHKRLRWLIRGVIQRRLTAIVVILLALTMIPLALVPWGVQPPATAIVCFGLALLGRDGLVALLGHLLAVGTVVTLYFCWGPLTAALGWLL